VLAVVVHAANIQDRDGAKLGLERLRHKFSRLRCIWADGGYAGQLVEWVRGLRVWRKLRLEIVSRPEGVKGFLLLTVGGRTHLRVVEPLPPLEQRL
jgi:putative transposase